MSTKLSLEILEKFLDLAIQLSPENLSCDGMLPKNVIERKYQYLHREWRLLEQTVGHKVSENEVWRSIESTP